ncbi:MAG: FlgD immunoglobulin-like domain containing protein, partial [Candidatus Eisenbacteria bacterium]
GALSAGSHAVTWDGRDDGGASVSSGVYFYRLQAGEFSESKRMTLIR